MNKYQYIIYKDGKPYDKAENTATLHLMLSWLYEFHGLSGVIEHNIHAKRKRVIN